MKSVSGNTTGLGAHVLNAAARSRAILVSLLLPALGGVTSGLQAQANPGPEPNLSLITFADSRLDNVCVGESAGFRVIAIRRTNPAVRVNEVSVTARVEDTTYGTLKVGYGRTSALANPPSSTAFTFVGRNAGMTEIHIDGVGSALTGDDNLQTKTLTRAVTVVSCDSPTKRPVGPAGPGRGSGGSEDRKSEVKATTISKVRVTTRSTWSAGMDIVATIDDGVMLPDKQGHFTGSAKVKWWTSVIGSARCGAAEYTIPPSEADLAGEINDSKQLVVTITFEPRDFSGFATCGPSISTGNIATPATLTAIVPLNGGTSTQDHEVTAKNGSFAGSATIVVTPQRK